MGVKGLWKLLEPTGRPVTLESLENKVLGVDTSLLLNQSVKGIRDKEGNALPNAHLVGLFHRVCKLLFYRIKPVFVFDGGVPQLKKQTLAERRERRMKAMHGSSRAAERIVKNYLKGKALEAVTGEKSCATVRSTSPREPDLFELPPLPQESTSQESSSDEEEPESSAMEHMQLQNFQTVSGGINVESDDFKALTPEIQHELIMDMKQERKLNSLTAMPQHAASFSDFQLEGVLKRGRLNLRLEELRKEMANQSTGQVSGLTSHDSLVEESTVKSQKIASEDTGHYILIKKGGRQQSQPEKQEDFRDAAMDGGFIPEDTDYEILSKKPNVAKQAFLPSPPSFKISDSEESSDEENSGNQRTGKAKGKRARDLSEQHHDKEAIAWLDGGTEKGGLAVGVNTDVPEDNEDWADVDQSSVVVDGRNATLDETRSADATAEQSELQGVVVRREESRVVTALVAESLVNNRSASSKRKQAGNVDARGRHADQQICSDAAVSPSDVPGVDQVKKRELHEAVHKKILIDLTGGPADIDGMLGCQKGRNYSVADGRVTIDLTGGDGDEVGETREQQGLEGQSPGVSEDEEQHAGFTADGNGRANASEERLKSGARAPVVTDPSAAIGATGKGLTVDNHRLAESISEVEEPASAGVGTPESASEVKPDASTPTAEGTDERREKGAGIHGSGGHSELEIVREPHANESVSTLHGEVQGSTDEIPREWLRATEEDLAAIQQGLAAEQHELAEERARQNRMAATVSSDMLTESQELLRLFGVPYVDSPMEAEAQCAALDITGLTDGSITDDSDVFLFGGRTVYKNVFNQTKHAELYLSETVQRALGVDRSKLICLAYITGSDYTEGIQGIGIVGAMEVLLEFPGDGLEGLKRFKEWHQAVQQQEKPAQETKVKRKLRSAVLSNGFPSEQVYDAYAHPVVDNSMEEFKWGKPDLHGLRLFALDKLGWPRSKTDEMLLPVLKELNRSENQLKIDRFLQVQFKEKRKIQSKRIRRVVNRFSHPSTDQDGAEWDEDQVKRKGAKRKKQRSAVSARRGRGRKASGVTSSPGEERNNFRSRIEEAKETTLISQEDGDQSQAKKSRTATNPNLQRLNGDGKSEDGDMEKKGEKRRKRGSQTQKRSGSELLDVNTERGPSKRTRAQVDAGLRQDRASCTRPDDSSKSSDGISPPDGDCGTFERQNVSHSPVNPNTGTPQEPRDCKPAAQHNSRRGQVNEQPLARSATAATERDSTSSDSEGSDDYCYTGPQPESVIGGGGARGRPPRGRGRGRGPRRTRV